MDTSDTMGSVGTLDTIDTQAPRVPWTPSLISPLVCIHNNFTSVNSNQEEKREGLVMGPVYSSSQCFCGIIYYSTVHTHAEPNYCILNLSMQQLFWCSLLQHQGIVHLPILILDKLKHKCTSIHSEP